MDSHLLGHNFSLAKHILHSSLKKLSRHRDRLLMIDDVVEAETSSGVIEAIPDLNDFIKQNPTSSFMAHMPVFRFDNESTKCRLVFLSNLCYRSSKCYSLSHNQVILPGPVLNRKMSTSIIQLRFDKKILVFDIVKASSQLQLPDLDKKKLAFVWFKNVRNCNFELTGYLSSRLPFGLRCSPSLLMLAALYHILIRE